MFFDSPPTWRDSALKLAAMFTVLGTRRTASLEGSFLVQCSAVVKLERSEKCTLVLSFFHYWTLLSVVFQVAFQKLKDQDI
jgi:hypothetical protein